jgi:site-specific DNA recombinase
MCRKYAKERGYPVVAELAEDDRGASGAEIDLPQLNRVRVMAQANEFDVLVVKELDRLSRNLAKQLVIEQELRHAGVAIEYVLGEYPDTPEGNLMKHVRATIAEFEREKIVERSIRGRRNMVRQGKIMLHGNKPPYGYRVSDDGATLVPYEPEASMVRLIFQWYTEGDESGKRLSSTQIAKRLSDMEMPTWVEIHPGSDGCKKRPFHEWSPDTVLRILHNEAYMGRWHYGKHQEKGYNPREHWVPMEVPALVSVKIWEQAQKQSRANIVMGPRNLKNAYLMRYRLTCKLCGRGIGTLTTKCNGKPYPYYICYGRMNHRVSANPKCNLPYFKVGEVDTAIWKWVKQFLTDPAALIEGLKDQQAELEGANNPLRERLAVIDSLLADHSRQLEKLLDLYLGSDFSKEMLVERKARLEDTIEALKRERAVLSAQLETRSITDEQVTTITEFARKVARGLEAADKDLDAQRRVIELLDVRATLGIEDGRNVVYIQCMIGEDALQVAPTRSSSAQT